ncbi:perlucin-like protein [Patiria miniata]|uniref:C-type lectin domain-containing protein n=1 Tax=Patiria miniata TaxID=46514 RepID=A0A914B6Z9_PATMI|nr:perlucin-like protein [Patiria miniata]XP_038071232.1 perlucin-like protein [Patiria miniata]
MMVSKRFIFGLISLHLMVVTGGNEMCKASIGGRRGACPPTWYQWGRKCYKAITERLTWSEAKDECIKMGSVLVMPQSQEETDFLLQLQQSNFWINCNDLQDEGTWKCENDEVEFRNWSTGPQWLQPDNLNGEHCAMVWVDQEGKWNDVRCDSQLPAICNQPAPQLHF